jgi:hypothetical protein
MFGERKPFSQALHKNNDPQSRRIVKEYFLRNKMSLNDNPNKYGVDLISEDQSLQVEVEHRLVWKDDEFPYDQVNVPERKAKFFVENHVCYVILSCDYSHIGMIDGKTLRQYINDDTLKESSNKYVRQGEFFYKVPKSAFRWDKI